MPDDPLSLAIYMTLNERYHTKTFVSDLRFDHQDDIAVGIQSIKQNIFLSDSSRKITHKKTNPDLTVHDVYTLAGTKMEIIRCQFTAFACQHTSWLRGGPVEQAGT